MGRVAGKVALITGAARGQGRSHAVRLAQEGADIIALDICAPIATATIALSTTEDLAETVRLVEAQDRRIVARAVDVRDRAALHAAVAEAVAELGGLDVVVANAGICPLGPDVPLEGFLDTVQVDLVGVLNTFEAGLAHLQQRGGSMIAIGSTASMMAGGGLDGAGGAGYMWAKRTVAQLVHEMALQCGPHGIRVNAVHPTNVDTAMLFNDPLYRLFRPDLDAPTLDDAEPGMQAMHALPVPWVETADSSNAVLFLASDESRYVTGLQLKVDAGVLTRQAFPGMGITHG
jgi:SDR family mycofactocin-dependent oxidoreductase